MKAHFYLTAYFWNTYFGSVVNFEKTIFDSHIDFYSTIFKSDVEFSYAHFHSKATFQKASFGGKCNFNKTILPDTLDFRYITDIKYEIDFTTTQLDSTKRKKCVILLFGTDISKVKINMQLFKIGFTDDEGYEQRASVYEKLLAKFKQEGFQESYKLLDIEYQRYKLLHDGSLIGKLLDWFQTYWWNYGYNKEWVLRGTFILLLLFSFVNYWLFQRLIGVYRLEFLDDIVTSVPDKQLWKLPCVVLLLFLYSSALVMPSEDRLLVGSIVTICIGILSFMAARIGIYPAKYPIYLLGTVVYTGMIFFRLKIELEKSNIKKHPWLFLYTLFLYTIGLICTGFIANVIFTK